jgi:hypothetical protein
MPGTLNLFGDDQMPGTLNLFGADQMPGTLTYLGIMINVRAATAMLNCEQEPMINIHTILNCELKSCIMCLNGEKQGNEHEQMGSRSFRCA